MVGPPTGSSSAVNELPRYEALDSLRGIAACVIVLFHFQSAAYLSRPAAIQNGWLMVDFFFVLSGFVIMASYGQRLREGYSLTRFAGLRLGRLYPLHFVVLIGFVLFELLRLAFPVLADRPALPVSGQIDELLGHLSLVQIFRVESVSSWNYPAWSIMAELWTYVIAALLLAYAKRAFWWLIALGIALSAGVLLHSGQIGPSGVLSLPRCFMGFALGMAAFRFVHADPVGLKRLGIWTATALEVTVVLAVLAILGWVPGQFTVLPIFVLAVILFAQQRGHLSALLRGRALRWLGLMSYAIYMVHALVQEVLLSVLQASQRALGMDLVAPWGSAGLSLMVPRPLADVITLVMFALVIFFAWALHRLVEAPGRLWSRRVFTEKVPAAN